MNSVLTSLLVPLAYTLILILLAIPHGLDNKFAWYPLWYSIILYYLICFFYYNGVLVIAYLFKITFTKSLFLVGGIYASFVIVESWLDENLRIGSFYLPLSPAFFLGWNWVMDKFVFRMKRVHD